MMLNSHADQELREVPPSIAQATSSVLADCDNEAVVVLSRDLTIRYANDAGRVVLESFGTDVSEVDTVERVLHPDDKPAARAAVRRAIASGHSNVAVRMLMPEGERRVEIALTNHLGTPDIAGIVCCFRSLVHEAALRKSLERQRQLDRHLIDAMTDELTGLAMRRLFLDRLEVALRSCNETDVPLTVFFIDLDGFKAINDTLGHAAGDAMLRSTTRRLLDTYAQPEQWGRIGGDEFVLFIENCDATRATEIAHRLSRALKCPMMLSGRSFFTSASVGVAVIEHESIGAEGAVRRADIAMYEMKRHDLNGRIGCRFFEPEMEQRVVDRAEIEGQLRRVLLGSGPDVVFQPIVDLGSGQIYAVESLARWISPTQGTIGPDRFVTIAEEIGVVDQLDRHVLRKACRSLAGLTDPVSGLPLDLTVNISTPHLVMDDFCPDLLRVLDATGFDPERLIVEVTESIALEHHDVGCSRLNMLRSCGIRVALDDFGTGQSSLAQLEELPVDLVKIDRSFLRGVPESPRRLRYIETIIAMANALELKVIFEGIESVAQARALTKLGVTLGQGYLMARPARRDEIQDSLAVATETVQVAVNSGVSWQPVIQWDTDPVGVCAAG